MPKSDTDATFDQSRQSDEHLETGNTPVLPDVLDWDACLEIPPPRRSGSIKVRLNFLGRGKPVPLVDPERLDDDASREAR